MRNLSLLQLQFAIVVLEMINQIQISQQLFNRNKSSSIQEIFPNKLMKTNAQQRELQTTMYPSYDPDILTLKLEGDVSQGFYYTNLFVGTPPQRQSVIVDTGSDITAFPCDPCPLCGTHQDPQFEGQASSSFQPSSCSIMIEQFKCDNCTTDNMNCRFNIDYYEGSHLEGIYYQDTVVVGNYIQSLYDVSPVITDAQALRILSNTKVPLTFGCTSVEGGYFYTQYPDGIMGLAADTNIQAPPSLVDYTQQYFPLTGLTANFALCLGSEGGYMTIGGYNSNLHTSGASTITINYKSLQGLYAINVYSMTLNGVDLGLVQSDWGINQTPFVDSGTTYTYVSTKIFSAIQSSMYFFCRINGHCDGPRIIFSGNANCWQYNRVKYSNVQDFLNTFPTMQFGLDNGQMLEWAPQDYLQVDQYTTNSKIVYCLTALPLRGTIILGSTFMHNYDIYFDKANSQLKLTRSDCGQNYNVDLSKFTQFDANLSTPLQIQASNAQQQSTTGNQQQSTQQQQTTNEASSQQSTSTSSASSASSASAASHSSLSNIGLILIIISASIVFLGLAAYGIVKCAKTKLRVHQQQHQDQHPSQSQLQPQIGIPMGQAVNSWQYPQQVQVSDLQLHQNYNYPTQQLHNQNPMEMHYQNQQNFEEQLKKQFAQSQFQ